MLIPLSGKWLLRFWRDKIAFRMSWPAYLWTLYVENGCWETVVRLPCWKTRRSVVLRVRERSCSKRLRVIPEVVRLGRCPTHTCNRGSPDGLLTLRFEIESKVAGASNEADTGH